MRSWLPWIVSALVSAGGSYGAVRVTLETKVDRVEFTREIARVDREIVQLRGEFTAKQVEADQRWERITQSLDGLQSDVRAIRCAAQPSYCR